MGCRALPSPSPCLPVTHKSTQTSAWNYLAVGTKRWVLVHPDVPADALHLRDEQGALLPAVLWFECVLPLILLEYPGQVFQHTQQPGETMFVPAGWWHGVINVTDTVAVTQNVFSLDRWFRAGGLSSSFAEAYASLRERSGPRVAAGTREALVSAGATDDPRAVLCAHAAAAADDAAGLVLARDAVGAMLIDGVVFAERQKRAEERRARRWAAAGAGGGGAGPGLPSPPGKRRR